MSESETPPAVSPQDADTAQRIWEALGKVADPELHYDIVNLGLVFGVEVKDGAALVRMTFTSPGCPYGPYLLHQAKEAIRTAPGVASAEVDLVFEPAWGPALMSEEARLDLGFDI